MTTLFTLSIICNVVLLVLWQLARRDNEHERAASVEISRQWAQETKERHERAANEKDEILEASVLR